MSFEAYQKGVEEREKKDQEICGLKERMDQMQKDLQDIKEFEMRRMKDPDYGRRIFEQQIVDEMKRTGKDLKTVLSEKLSIDAMISPERIASIKKLPRIQREVVTEEWIDLVKSERGCEEAERIRGLLVDN
jgi:hypothetical protein